jgi:hypothetical protein
MGVVSGRTEDAVCRGYTERDVCTAYSVVLALTVGEEVHHVDAEYGTGVVLVLVLVVRIIVSGSLMHARPPGDLLKAVAEFSWR